MPVRRSRNCTKELLIVCQSAGVAECEEATQSRKLRRRWRFRKNWLHPFSGWQAIQAPLALKKALELTNRMNPFQALYSLRDRSTVNKEGSQGFWVFPSRGGGECGPFLTHQFHRVGIKGVVIERAGGQHGELHEPSHVPRHSTS
jgi:hypothetical protein